MIKWESQLRAFIPMFGAELKLRRYLVWIYYGLNTLLFNISHLQHECSVSISCNLKTKFYYELQTYIHSYWYKVTKKLFKKKKCNVNHQGSSTSLKSCKLGFSNSSLENDLIKFSYTSIFYHHSKDFQAHPNFSTETINSIMKQGKPWVHLF